MENPVFSNQENPLKTHGTALFIEYDRFEIPDQLTPPLAHSYL